MNHPHFPITRHIQRYEYITDMGYVTDKTVVDIGCAFGYGTGLVSFFAKACLGVDPVMKDYVDKSIMLPTFSLLGRSRCPMTILPVRWEDINTRGERVDVILAIEFIEHLQEPDKFLEFASNNCYNLFVTTPLAEVTGPTGNKEHVAEYSHDDFIGMVSKYFDIEEELYQTSDLRIEKSAKPNGFSCENGHVVQMLWCKAKGV